MNLQHLLQEDGNLINLEDATGRLLLEESVTSFSTRGHLVTSRGTSWLLLLLLLFW